MKLKTVITALGVISPLALISSSNVPANGPKANDMLRQANEARRARQANNGNNVMTLDRMNKEEKQREQQQQQQANNANQQAAQTQAQQQAALMAQQAAQAQQQAAQAQLLAQMQEQARFHAEEMASLKLALELDRQERERAGQRPLPFSGKQQENKEQEQKQNPRASSSSSAPKPAPSTTQQRVNQSVNEINGMINNAGSGILNYGREALGIAKGQTETIKQNVQSFAQQGDDLRADVDQFLHEEVAPVLNGAQQITENIIDWLEYFNPGKDDRPKKNNGKNKTNRNNAPPKPPVNQFKKYGL